MSVITMIVVHNRRGRETIVAHNSHAGSRGCGKEVLQEKEYFASNKLDHIVGVELLST